MKIFRTILFTLFFLLVFNISKAQSNKNAEVITSGYGNTLEDAKQNALKSAIEQAFGVFISTKTELLNDQITSDQITSISNGNIKSYEILNKSQLTNGQWGVTIKSIVSIDKLQSFITAKGINIDMQGDLFAINIKQQILNEQAEIKAVAEMVGLLHEPLQNAFDYLIQNYKQKSIDNTSKFWEISFNITSYCNKNFEICSNYFIETLSVICLSSKEVKSYKSLGKTVFPIKIKNKIYYLRKQQSLDIIQSMLHNWESYNRLFVINNNLSETLGDNEAFSKSYNQIKKITSREYGPMLNSNFQEVGESFTLNINFPKVGEYGGFFYWKENRSLNEIEKMKVFTVKPRGVISQFRQGGYVIYEKNGHGLVASVVDLGEMNWNDAKSACEALELNGYKDWRLPSADEMHLIYKDTFLKRIGKPSPELVPSNYWCNDILKDSNEAFYFDYGSRMNVNQTAKHFSMNVRAVRSF